jgi:hypothetical protein
LLNPSLNTMRKLLRLGFLSLKIRSAHPERDFPWRSLPAARIESDQYVDRIGATTIQLQAAGRVCEVLRRLASGNRKSAEPESHLAVPETMLPFFFS